MWPSWFWLPPPSQKIVPARLIRAGQQSTSMAQTVAQNTQMIGNWHCINITSNTELSKAYAFDFPLPCCSDTCKHLTQLITVDPVFYNHCDERLPCFCITGRWVGAARIWVQDEFSPFAVHRWSRSVKICSVPCMMIDLDKPDLSIVRCRICIRHRL